MNPFLLLLIALSFFIYFFTANLPCKLPMEYIENSDTLESTDTVIISVDSDFNEDIFDSYNFEIIYKYENFPMYTLRTKKVLSTDDFNKLISDLSQEPHVISVEKDSKIYLD